MFIILSTIVSHLVGMIQTGLSYGWDTCHSRIGAFDLGLLTTCHLVGDAQFGIILIASLFGCAWSLLMTSLNLSFLQNVWLLSTLLMSCGVLVNNFSYVIGSFDMIYIVKYFAPWQNDSSVVNDILCDI